MKGDKKKKDVSTLTDKGNVLRVECLSCIIVHVLRDTGIIDDHNKKQVLPKVIWEERIAVSQLFNRVPIGYNGCPKFTFKTALSSSMFTISI